MNHSNSLDKDKSLIISHDELFNDYENIIHKITEKFNLKLKNRPIIKPEGYFDRGGARSVPLKNKKYKHE